MLNMKDEGGARKYRIKVGGDGGRRIEEGGGEGRRKRRTRRRIKDEETERVKMENWIGHEIGAMRDEVKQEVTCRYSRKKHESEKLIEIIKETNKV